MATIGKNAAGGVAGRRICGSVVKENRPSRVGVPKRLISASGADMTPKVWTSVVARIKGLLAHSFTL